MEGYNNTLALTKLLEKLTYKENWNFELHHGMNALIIGLKTVDSTGNHNPFIRNYFTDVYREFYDYTLYPDGRIESRPFMVAHRFEIPPYKMNADELERWVLDCIIQVETHEAMEFFKVGGVATFFPDHDDPYKIERRA